LVSGEDKGLEAASALGLLTVRFGVLGGLWGGGPGKYLDFFGELLIMIQSDLLRSLDMTGWRWNSLLFAGFVVVAVRETRHERGRLLRWL
jgi:hypothetical protein